MIVTATGTVQPTTEVEVSSELSGTLAEVAVDYNDRVEVGQMLARLDSRKMEAQVANAEAALARARAQVTQAEATVRQADAELTRARALDRRGITSQSNLETAEAEDDRARAALESARADLTLAMANLALEEADLDKAQIRSPIRGSCWSARRNRGRSWPLR
ncbi:efflux RND transporter periplasmic adaptor subunit [Gemmobacter lanyuensis]